MSEATRSLVDQMQRDASQDDLLRQGWNRRIVTGDSVLWHEGDPADSLAIVTRGRLAVLVDGRAVAEIGPGESVGEASVFFPRERRRGSVVAREETELWLLERAHLVELRRSTSDAYDALLSIALAEVWRHLEVKDAEICAFSQGRLESPRQSEPGALERIWQRLTRTAEPAPEALAVLGAVPGFGLASADSLRELAEAMSPRRVQAGRALFLQGDEGRAIDIVAGGEIAILRNAVGESAHELIVLGPGSMFGAGGYVAGQRRSASAVARGDAWVLEITPEVAHALSPEPRRLLHEAILATMRSQLYAANRLFARMTRPEDDFARLIAAVGHLAGWRAGDPGTEAVLYAIPEPDPVAPDDPDTERLLAAIRDGVIGADVALDTPFGPRRVVYADYTASGRSLAFIEDYLREQVMPMYANTHTEASASGLQTTRFREEARALVARSVGAGDDDEVVFVGSGALRRTLEIVRAARAEAGVDISSSVNLFIGDGTRIVALRFTFDFGRYALDPGKVHEGNLRFLSLWYTVGERYEEVDGGWTMRGDVASADAVLVASEPLSRDQRGWVEVPEYSALVVEAREGRQHLATVAFDV